MVFRGQRLLDWAVAEGDQVMERLKAYVAGGLNRRIDRKERKQFNREIRRTGGKN